jgi:hypothetical protein
MGKPTVLPNEHDLMLARSGINTQLTTHGVATTPEVELFAAHMVGVLAQMYAWHRFQEKIIQNLSCQAAENPV